MSQPLLNSFCWGWCAALGLLLPAATGAGEPSVERGKAMLLSRVHIEPSWPEVAYDNAWKVWGLAEKPGDYDAAFRRRYGLHEAPYPNGGLPMGLRRVERNGEKLISVDCLLCHGGAIAGRSYVGLPNSTLDLAAIYRELTKAAERPYVQPPFSLSTSRGTVNASAGTAAILSFRNPDLSLRLPDLNIDWGIYVDVDVPAWWHWKRKKTLYADGFTSAESTRSMMVSLAASPVMAAEDIQAAEADWRDMRAFIRTLGAPKYPWKIDAGLAAAGEAVFTENCARCHGTYGADGRYPNKIVPLDEIGTDRARVDSVIAEGLDYWNKTWFAKEHPGRLTGGYQAPPLDGIWASAPYLHNGSVPTVYGVLNSASRPALYRRRPTTAAENYDRDALGWKVEVLQETPEGFSASELRELIDTTKFGKGNGGHEFGDHLSDEERLQVIEYLKTL